MAPSCSAECLASRLRLMPSRAEPLLAGERSRAMSAGPRLPISLKPKPSAEARRPRWPQRSKPAAMPKGEGNSSSITRTGWPGAAKAGMRLAIRARSSARRCRSRLCSVRNAVISAMVVGKVVHEMHQPLDGRHLHGVVQAGPYAANRTVALQIVQPVSCGLMEKIIEQAGVLELKAHIDSRAIRRDLRAAIEVMAVEALI